MKKLYLLGILLFTVGLFLDGCSASPSEPVSFQLELKEYSITPQTITVQVGQEVTMQISNTGVLEHELMIGRDVNIQDSRPSGYVTDIFQKANLTPKVQGGAPADSGSQNHAHTGTMVVVPPGGQASITFPVTEAMVGEWEMGCFAQLGVHYDAGMKGKFIVNP